MADFPQHHTTTTTTTNVPGGRVYLDISYIKTIPGILCIVEIVLSIIVFICSVSACNATLLTFSACGWSGFVSFMAFILVVAWLIIHLLHINEALPRVPWLLVEMIFYAVWSFLYFTCIIGLAVLAASWYGANVGGIRAGAGAGAFFACLALLVFGFHTFLVFKNWNSERAMTQGQGGGGHA